MHRFLLPASALTALMLAGPAAGASDQAALNRMLQEKCSAVSAELVAATDPQIRCTVGQAHGLVDGKRADGEIASLALKACASTTAPIRDVLGRCAGDQADAAMDGYIVYAMNRLVLGLIKGREAALYNQLPTPAGKEGPVFDALADHLACVSINSFVASDSMSDREAVAKQAIGQCAPTRAAFDAAVKANLKDKEAAAELSYADRVALDEAHGEFDAKHRAAATPQG
jgi:hypothetical protein